MQALATESRGKTRALILAPTRELAVQIAQHLKELAKHTKVSVAAIYGGVGFRDQTLAFKRGCDIIVATPGRLLDHVGQGTTDFSGLTMLVLDEADRMLDMGFINDIKFLIAKLPRERHTLFFSATFSREIEQLAGTLLHDPLKISVKKHDTSRNVEQDVVRVRSKEEKFATLCNLLRSPGFGKVLVFGRTKHGVEKLSIALSREGFKTTSIHGNKSQPQRQQALKSFKDEKVQIMVATDVAARGLDIPNVTHVINYELPQSYDDYVHRIGRTGRAGKGGTALTFVGGD